MNRKFLALLAARKCKDSLRHTWMNQGKAMLYTKCHDWQFIFDDFGCLVHILDTEWLIGNILLKDFQHYTFFDCLQMVFEFLLFCFDLSSMFLL